MSAWFLGLSKRIERAIASSGVTPESLAAEIGVTPECIYDLLWYDDELMDVYTVGTSIKIANILGLTLGELLVPGYQGHDRLTFSDLASLVRERIASSGSNLCTFEKKIGWGLLGMLEDAERVNLLPLACLRDLCVELGIDLVRVIS